jgi:hypothetical protein
VTYFVVVVVVVVLVVVGRARNSRPSWLVTNLINLVMFIVSASGSAT